MTKLSELKSLDDIVIDPTPWIPKYRMKGRRYKARMRDNARWERDPVVRCDKCGHEIALAEDVKLCYWKYCQIILCSCGKISVSWGPIDCPCDRGGHGHSTYAEMPKPKVRVK